MHTNCWAEVFDFTPSAVGQPPNWLLLPPGMLSVQQLLGLLPREMQLQLMRPPRSEAPGGACAHAAAS